MDRLSELLSSVRAKGASWLYVDADASASWGVALRHRPSIFCVHHVVSGRASLSLEGERHGQSLLAGDVVALPHGPAHTLRDRFDGASTSSTPLEDLPEARIGPNDRDRSWQLVARGANGSRAATKIVSALIELEDPFSAPIVSSLPSVLQLGGSGAEDAPLVVHLGLVARDLASKPFGSDLLLARMADVVFVHVMRAYVETLSNEGAHSCRSLDRVRALRDPGVAAAMGLMSQRPQDPWTVASLAEQVGLSRSAFARRFTSLVGEPPLGFLTRIRMQRATELLREGATLAMTSQLAGYSSEASFGHAFRQWSGVAPGAYRRGQSARRGGREDA